MRAALVAVAALCLAGGPVTARDSCPAGLHPATTAELFFGADIPGGGQISDADWRDFLNSEVTPRVPEGLDVVDLGIAEQAFDRRFDNRAFDQIGVDDHMRSVEPA